MAENEQAKAEPADVSVAEAKQRVEKRENLDRIVIHPFPKVVLLWPVMVGSLLFYFLGGGLGATDAAGSPSNPLADPSALGPAHLPGAYPANQGCYDHRYISKRCNGNRFIMCEGIGE